jgi:tRNA(Ile)-lysidine synthase
MRKNFLYKLKENETIFVKEINTYITTEIKNDDFVLPKLIKNKVFLDYGKVKRDMYVRNRLPGDRFIPLGMNGTKKIKDFYIDIKVPAILRDSIPLIVSGDDILWVVGYRISEEYKCTDTTKKILMISVDKGEYNDERRY